VKTFEGVRQLRKQWEERTSNAHASQSNKPANNAAREEATEETTSPLQPGTEGKEKESAKPVSETEPQRFCQVMELTTVYTNSVVAL
jgi:hypothetical protein